MLLTNKVSYVLFNQHGNYRNIMQFLVFFLLVLEGETGKEIPESSRLEFLEKFLANNSALSGAEDNTSVDC